LFPGLRLAYLVVPEPLAELFVNARVVAGRQSPTFEQVLVERFIAEGRLFRHILRMRRLYQARRTALIEACGERLGRWLRLEPGETGLQMLGWLPAHWSDAAVSRAAATAGLEVAALLRFAIERALPPTLLLGFSAFPRQEIRQAMDRLAEVVRDHAARGAGIPGDRCCL
jgi:GntR family transcriptional regulator/MocR family aminotransferase